MNGIDISGWQAGIDIPDLIANSDTDFVIIKATEGVSYTNPYWQQWADEVLASGALLGLYHYSDGGDITAEANFFLDTVRDYVGRALLVLDWEAEGNGQFEAHAAWTNPWLNYVAESTGSAPVLYVMQSRLDCYDWPYLWVAQYPGYDPQGYGEPWNEGWYSDLIDSGRLIIRQYSSSGRIGNYGGNLDINKAYIDRARWIQMAGGAAEEIKEDDDMAYVDNEIYRHIIETDYYPALLHREADFGGVMVHLRTAISDGLLAAANSIISSDEWQGMNLSGTERVKDFYLAFLGRTATNDEAQGWLDTNGTDLYAIAGDIYNSDEAAAHRASLGL